MPFLLIIKSLNPQYATIILQRQLSRLLLVAFRLQDLVELLVFLLHIEAGAGLGSKFVVAVYALNVEFCQQCDDKVEHHHFLHGCARVAGISLQ